MKCDIFKGLLLCGCMMSALDSEGMQVVLQPCRRPVANQEAVVAKEMLETRQQRMALMNGFLPKTRPQHKGGPVKEENIENAVLPQSPASISTSSEEQAQYPTSVTFTAENIKDFYNLTTEVAQKLKSVTFEGVNIDQNFVGQFKCLFRCGGLDGITFDGCDLKDGEEYNNLFNSSYDVVNLTINDKNLTNDDAIIVYCSLNQLEIGGVCFSGQNLDRKFIMEELSLCDANPREYLSINE